MPSIVLCPDGLIYTTVSSFQIYSRPRAGLDSGDKEMIQNLGPKCDPFPMPSTTERPISWTQEKGPVKPKYELPCGSCQHDCVLDSVCVHVRVF